MSRLFIALNIENEIKVSLESVNNFLKGYSSLLKVVPQDNYHLTLKFLGETESGIRDKMISDFKLQGQQIFKAVGRVHTEGGP